MCDCTLLNVGDSTGGYVRVEFQGDSVGGEGTYYTCLNGIAAVSYNLVAVPNPGYRFVRWDSDITAHNGVIYKVLPIGPVIGKPIGYDRPVFDPDPQPLVCNAPYKVCVQVNKGHYSNVTGDNTLVASNMVEVSFNGVYTPGVLCKTGIMTPGAVAVSISLKSTYTGCFYIAKVLDEAYGTLASYDQSTATNPVNVNVTVPTLKYCDRLIYVVLARKMVEVDFEARDVDGETVPDDLMWYLKPLPMVTEQYQHQYFRYFITDGEKDDDKLRLRARYFCGTEVEFKLALPPTSTFQGWECVLTPYHCPTNPTVNPCKVTLDGDYLVTNNKMIGAKFTNTFAISAIKFNSNASDRSAQTPWYTTIPNGLVARFNAKDIASGDLNLWFKFNRPVNTSTLVTNGVDPNFYLVNEATTAGRYDDCGTGLSGTKYFPLAALSNYEWSEGNTVLRIKVKARYAGNIYKALKGSSLRIYAKSSIHSSSGAALQPYEGYIRVENPELNITFPKFDVMDKGSDADLSSLDFGDVYHYVLVMKKTTTSDGVVTDRSFIQKTYGPDLASATKADIDDLLGGIDQYELEPNNTVEHFPAPVLVSISEVEDNATYEATYTSVDLNSGNCDDPETVWGEFHTKRNAAGDRKDYITYLLDNAVIAHSNSVYLGALYRDIVYTGLNGGSSAETRVWSSKNNWGANNCHTDSWPITRRRGRLYFRTQVK